MRFDWFMIVPLFLLNSSIATKMDVMTRLPWEQWAQLCFSPFFKKKNTLRLSFLLISGEEIQNLAEKTVNKKTWMNVLEVVGRNQGPKWRRHCQIPSQRSGRWCELIVSQNQLELKDLQSQRQIQRPWLVFKSWDVGLVPEYLSAKIVSRNESNYALDSANKLVIHFSSINSITNSFGYSGKTL